MAADGLMAALVSSSSADVSALIINPRSGERQPESLLPIPATDSRGKLVFLYSSLVIDYGDKRIIIPDIWEPGWLALDLARALQDLMQGGPLSLGYLDGSGEGGSQLTGLLEGRWKTDEWIPGTSAADRFNVLLIRDGPALGSMENLVPQLEDYLAGGGRILMAGSAGSPLSLPGSWAAALNDRRGLLFIDDEDFLNPSAYEEGSRSFRDIDSTLLLAVGRRDLLKMMASDTLGFGNSGRGKAGIRLPKASLSPEKMKLPDEDKITGIIFSSEDSLFSLKKNEYGWTLVSRDWQLPARSDRIESFLGSLEKGSENLWKVSDLPSPGELPVITLSGGLFKSIELYPVEERLSGGGVYFNSPSGLMLWPGLNADEISVDARYWMERRLFPGVERIIRAELSSDNRLYWRLHEEGDTWVFTGKDGRNEFVDDKTAKEFSARLLRVEALTIAPAGGDEISPLVLKIEDERGRYTEYHLIDMDNGRVAAVSMSSGILFVLDESLVQFLLQPVIHPPRASASISSRNCRV